MFGTKSGGVAAYSKIGLETGVAAASPHKLVAMLFDGALQAVRNAHAQMKAGDIAAKGGSLAKATSIVTSGLRASLDLSQGGEIAASLDALYDYIARRLMHAHLHNDPAALDEVTRLLTELRDAWDAIGGAAAAPAAPPRPAADPLAPRPVSFASA